MFLLQRLFGGFGMQMTFRMDGGAAGSATEETSGAADAGETTESMGEETPEGEQEQSIDLESDAEELTEDAPETTETPEGAQPTPAATKAEKTVPLSALIKMRTELEGKIKEMHGQLQTVLPPEKDPIDQLLDSIPKDIDPESEAGKEALDIRALAPLMKKLRPALFPKERQFDRMFAAAAQGMDRLAFKIDQIIESMDPTTLPKGLQALEKIDAHRKGVYEKSGGKELPSHKDAFTAIMEQADAESTAAASTEQATRTDERQRTAREILQRRGASRGTGPGNVRPVPKTTGPKRLTFQQLDSGQVDVALP